MEKPKKVLGGKTVDFSHNPALSVAYVELKAVRQSIAAQEKRESQLKQTLQQAMGNASKATFASGQITWKKAKDTTALDVATMLKEKPYLQARYSMIKEGSRRFLII